MKTKTPQWWEKDLFDVHHAAYCKQHPIDTYKWRWADVSKLMDAAKERRYRRFIARCAFVGIAKGNPNIARQSYTFS